MTDHAFALGLTESVISPSARAALDRYVASHHGDLSNTDELADTMFRAGGNQAIKAMEEFADITGRLDRLAERIQQRADDVRALVGKDSERWTITPEGREVLR